MGERLREVLLYSDEQPDPRFWCNTYEVVEAKRGKRRQADDRIKHKDRSFQIKRAYRRDVDDFREIRHSDRKRRMRCEEEE